MAINIYLLKMFQYSRPLRNWGPSIIFPLTKPAITEASSSLFSADRWQALEVLFLLTSSVGKVADHQPPVILGGGGAAEHMGIVTPPTQPLARDEAVTVRGVWPQIPDGVLCHAITRGLKSLKSVLGLLILLRLGILLGLGILGIVASRCCRCCGSTCCGSSCSTLCGSSCSTCCGCCSSCCGFRRKLKTWSFEIHKLYNWLV